jgi:hypothetical protein
MIVEAGRTVDRARGPPVHSPRAVGYAVPRAAGHAVARTVARALARAAGPAHPAGLVAGGADARGP